MKARVVAMRCNECGRQLPKGAQKCPTCPQNAKGGKGRRTLSPVTNTPRVPKGRIPYQLKNSVHLKEKV